MTVTSDGALLREFEALLIRTFHTKKVSVSGRADFACSGDCAPLSRYRPYRFVFSHPQGTALKIAERGPFRSGTFGNADAILVRGRPVACRRRGTYLIAFAGTASFSLGCVSPL